MRSCGRKKFIVAVDEFSVFDVQSNCDSEYVKECDTNLIKALEDIYSQIGDRDFVIKCPAKFPQFIEVAGFVTEHDNCFLETVSSYVDERDNLVDYDSFFMEPEDEITFLYKPHEDAPYESTVFTIKGAEVASNLVSIVPYNPWDETQDMYLFGSTTVEDDSDNHEKMLYGPDRSKIPDLHKRYANLDSMVALWMHAVLAKACISFDTLFSKEFHALCDSAQFIQEVLKHVKGDAYTTEIEKASIYMEKLYDGDIRPVAVMEEY